MVKLISLKDQDETVLRFFELLVRDPGNAVVEVNGHRVYLIVRPATPTDQPDEPWTDAKSHRRAELVDRKIAGTITPTEVVELAELQGQMMRYVNRVAPLGSGNQQLPDSLENPANLARGSLFECDSC